MESIQRLKSYQPLELIKVVLEDTEKKQLRVRSIKIWLQQLEDAMYALDECSIKSTRLKGLSTFKLKNIKYFHDIGSRLKKIASKIDQIAKSKNKFLSTRRCYYVKVLLLGKITNWNGWMVLNDLHYCWIKGVWTIR